MLDLTAVTTVRPPAMPLSTSPVMALATLRRELETVADLSQEYPAVTLLADVARALGFNEDELAEALGPEGLKLLNEIENCPIELVED